MKKTALKRKTRLKPMSAKKKAMQPAYRAAVKAAKEAQIAEYGCTYCEKCSLSSREVEPHHPQGRIGKNLLIFRLVDRSCHEQIHSHPAAARLDGWLK